MELELNYIDENSLLKKLNRERGRAKKSIESNSLEDLADSFYNFSVTAYHITDWVKASSVKDRGDVNLFVKENAEISACRDIANTTKHFKITRYEPRDVSVVSTIESISEARYSSSGMIDIYGSISWQVVLDDKESYGILEFMDKVIETWKSYLA